MSDPVSQPVVVKVTSQALWLPTYKDKDGVVLTNKAKCPFQRAQESHAAVLSYHGTRFFASMPDYDMREYENTVNNATWRGVWLAGEAWISGFKVDPVDTAYGERFKAVITVRCLRGGWSVYVPNFGPYYLDGGVARAFDAEGLGKLDSSGGKLSTTADPEILEFKCNREISFTGLGF